MVKTPDLFLKPVSTRMTLGVALFLCGPACTTVSGGAAAGKDAGPRAEADAGAAGADAGAVEANAWPLRDGTVWVMAGDSITAQRLHTDYMEAFAYARYPQLSFAIRNSGVAGDTYPKVSQRFDATVANFLPTLITV